MKYCLFYLIILFPFFISAQEEDVIWKNHIYTNNICSPILSPLLNKLNGDGKLVLRFDDLDAELKNYSYTIEHCTKHWELSDLLPTDYIDGFNTGTIDEYHFSEKTIIPYVYYELELPNENTSWKISGNYILKVYNEDGEEPELAFTKRFMVYDHQVKVTGETLTSKDFIKSTTQHIINFNVNQLDLNIFNPNKEIEIVAYQNFRSDNALYGFKPSGSRQKNLLFENLDSLYFPASKEFRIFDLTEVKSKRKGERIEKIKEESDGIFIDLETDQVRTNTSMDIINHHKELDGIYLIRNEDCVYKFQKSEKAIDFNLENKLKRTKDPAMRKMLQDNAKVDKKKNRTTIANCHKFRAEYIDVVFSFESSPFENQDLYVIGGFTDWEPKEEFKLTFNKEENLYKTTGLLKQGLYNYFYVLVDENGNMDFSKTEGNAARTKNVYTIMVYYSPIDSNYDQLIGYGIVK